MFLPRITDHYEASFVAWTFSFYVQNIILGVDAEDLKDEITFRNISNMKEMIVFQHSDSLFYKKGKTYISTTYKGNLPESKC